MSIASSSDSTDWNIELFPMDGLSDDEDDDHHSNSADASDEHESESETEEKPKSFMTLRQRRLSKSLAPLAALKVNVNINRAHSHWLTAIRKAKVMADPWAAFHIEDMKSEQCIRHRYNPHKADQWIQDEVTVRMEKTSFNRGAMRQCYRLKKLSTFTRSGDWNHAMNYVAKRYIDNVDRDVYFQDVKLQMDAKVWGEEFNRHNPPKKVDIFQMYILEFKDRPGSPLYHLEHYIEGEYVKYNSNSGFVEETLRYTPQAFSHFTFERSGHKLIVVDIQGVGDLYTDPQIHTIDGKEYNEGNLGAKGMALFFHTHICNDICRSLDLTEFDLSPIEVTMHKDFLRSQRKAEMKTKIRGLEEHCLSLSPTTNKIDITRFLDRQRSTSSMFSDTTPDSYSNDDEPMSVGSPLNNFRLRIRSPSDTDSQSSMTIEEERAAFSRMAEQRARPSCVALEKDLRKAMNLKIGDSILAKVHHEMAKYHEVGRFVTTENRNDIDVDWESAIFHELHAAELGELEAMVTMAKLYLGIERDVLVSCTVAENEDHTNSGVDFMVLAAEAGDRASMIFMAKAFESGLNLGTRRSISWEDAVYWYEQAAQIEETDESGEYDSTIYDPKYQLVAKQAEMYLQGGNGLDKDAQRAGDLYNEAAELAMAAMKGRLANKYFSLSEEAYGEVEEEEEEAE